MDTWDRMRIRAGIGPILCAVLVVAAADWCAAAEPNTWVKVMERKTGARRSPAWYYDPGIKKFVLTGGSGGWPLHWDNEEFDLSTGTFINAYPKGGPVEQFTPAEGPTKYPEMPKRGWSKRSFWKDKNGLWRIPWHAGYGDSSQAYHQFAYDAGGKRLVVYCRNQTFAYDPRTRTWSDTGAEAFSKGSAMHWGSLCYDPVNREILAVGGTSFEPGGTPGSWVFKCAANRWEKLDLGSRSLRNLNRMVAETKAMAWSLVGALRNRYYLTENAAEAEARIGERGAELLAVLEKITGGFGEARVEEHERTQVTRALRNLEAAKHALGRLKGRLDGLISAELIAEATAVHALLEKCDRNLDFEPTGRAFSRMCYDATNKVIVLFGGDGLDRQYADTWVYHCTERRWEQRWPARSPSPRAGHALLYLPESKTVWLGGGFTVGSGHSYMYGDAYWHLPWEAWTYDVAANEWRCILHVPLPKIRRGYGPGFKNSPKGWPWGDSRNAWTMAVGPAENVLFLRGGEVWAMTPDVKVASAELAAAHGVEPETIAVRGDSVHGRTSISYDPAFYDRTAKIDEAKTEAFYKTLPANQWTHITPPKNVDKCGWGTTAWDSDRQQFLFWGGGHSEYKGTNVFHYSTRSGHWSSSYNPGWVLEWSGGFLLKVETSFRDRPHVPVHAYQTYAYDPPTGKCVMVKWNHAYLYDPRNREFDVGPIRLPFPNRGVMHISVETTPRGAVVWTSGGELWCFNRTAFKRLPYQGPGLGSPWCDGSGMVYDTARERIWMAAGKQIVKYDPASGKGEPLPVTVPKVLGRFALGREPVPIPGTDLILLMRNYKAPDGKFKNVAVDVKRKKYFWIDLPYVSGGKPAKGRRGRPVPGFSWTSAMHWDARRELVWIHNPISFWALKFDQKTAKLEEVVD